MPNPVGRTSVRSHSLKQAAIRHQQIKVFYLSKKNRTEHSWQAVSQNPQKFNQVWRAMLRLPINDQPPPIHYRK